MVRLICYNIEYCEGMDGRWYEYLRFWKIFFPPKKLEDQLVNALGSLKPDILALVEVDTGSIRNRKRDGVEFMTKELKLNHFIEMVQYPFKGWLKLFHHLPLLKKQANALVSRYKFYDVKHHLLSKGTKRMVIQASVKCPKKVTLLLAHLALGKKARSKQLKELVNIVNSINSPVILMGDFNTFKGVNEIKELLERTHLNDMVELEKSSLHYTEPAKNPKRRLDYILTSPELLVDDYSILNFHFSDHLPVMVNFNFKK